MFIILKLYIHNPSPWHNNRKFYYGPRSTMRGGPCINLINKKKLQKRRLRSAPLILCACITYSFSFIYTAVPFQQQLQFLFGITTVSFDIIHSNMWNCYSVSFQHNYSFFYNILQFPFNTTTVSFRYITIVSWDNIRTTTVSFRYNYSFIW